MPPMTGSTSPGRRWRASSSITDRFLDDAGEPTPRYREHGVPGAILAFDALFDLASGHTCLRRGAKVAALADDIAYNAHDIDDGLRAGLFNLEDLRAIPFIAGLLDDIDDRWPGLETARRIHELTRRVITRMVEDVVAESERRIAALAPADADAIRAAAHPVVAFSPALREADRAIKNYPLSEYVSPPEGDHRETPRRPDRARAVCAFHG